MRQTGRYGGVNYPFMALLVLMVAIMSCDDKTPETLAPVVKVDTTLRLLNGYADRLSYYPGDECNLYLSYNQNRPEANINILNLADETVDVIRTMVCPQDTLGNQPWEDGFGYEVTYKYRVPELPAGIYLVGGKVPLIIKSREARDITVLYPSNTLNAYCTAGGKSLYSYLSTDNEEADIVSFMRPIPFANQHSSVEFFKWISFKGYDVAFISDSDMDSYENIKGTKVLMVVGHSEYWTRRARKNFDKFVDDGGDVIILSGNTMWWQVRYGSDNTMVCYREANEDSVDNPLLKSVTWDSPSLKYSIIGSIGADFEHGGYGKKEDKGWDGYKIVLDKSPLLEGTNLQNGQVLRMPSDEWDGSPVKGLTGDSIPIIDKEMLGFEKLEMIGFDRAYRNGKHNYGTFIVFRKNKKSGIVINTGSTDWCSAKSMEGQESEHIKCITSNMIVRLLREQPVFSE